MISSLTRKSYNCDIFITCPRKFLTRQTRNFFLKNLNNFWETYSICFPLNKKTIELRWLWKIYFINFV